MHKNEKFLNKISIEDKEKLLLVAHSIMRNDLEFLDIKKLSGSDNMYRVRVGKFRIKFIKYSKNNEIIEITRRSDNTY